MKLVLVCWGFPQGIDIHTGHTCRIDLKSKSEDKKKKAEQLDLQLGWMRMHEKQSRGL